MKSADSAAFRCIDHLRWGCSAVFLTDEGGRPMEVVRTGTSTLSMPATEHSRREYRILAQQGVHCFFDDDGAPRPTFYAVPMLNVFAWDECGGFWGTKGALADLDDLESPVYHVDAQLRVTKAADHLRAFLMPLETICQRIFARTPTEDITLYSSETEAQQTLPFLEPPCSDERSSPK